jgi:hypothetical protein
MRICMIINGTRHCFDIPLLVDREHLRPGPPPPNYPELELAATILELIDFVKPAVRDTEFTKNLTEVTTRYIQRVKEGLPKGVEISTAGLMEKAA